VPTTPVAPVNGQLTLRAVEWRFEPAAIVLKQGEQVRIDFQNGGEVPHDFKIAGLAATVLDRQNSGPLSGSGSEVFLSADSGGGGSITFVPLAPGTYELYCTVRGHRQLGMKGTVTVK